MGDIAYSPGHRRISKTSRAELQQYEQQAKEGKHFDKSSMIRVGLHLYPSSVFPLKNGKKALLNDYPRGFSLELIVGRLAEETNRAMHPEHVNNPEHEYQPTGDANLDQKLRRRIETSDTNPIVFGDLLQIAFIGFDYRWKDGKLKYVDFFKDQSYAQVPTLMYEITADDPLKKILRGKPFQGDVRRGKIPEDIGEALSQAENLDEFVKLPDKRITTIAEILRSYEIVNVYAQIHVHIKYSDKENRIPAGYQSGVKEDELKIKEEEVSELFTELRNEPAGKLAKLANKHKGDTKTIETDYSSLSKETDPGTETQEVHSTAGLVEDRSVDILQDPAFWNLLQQEPESTEDNQEFLAMLERSTAEYLASEQDQSYGIRVAQETPIDPKAETQQVQPPQQNEESLYDILDDPNIPIVDPGEEMRKHQTEISSSDLSAALAKLEKDRQTKLERRKAQEQTDKPSEGQNGTKVMAFYQVMKPDLGK